MNPKSMTKVQIVLTNRLLPFTAIGMDLSILGTSGFAVFEGSFLGDLSCFPCLINIKGNRVYSKLQLVFVLNLGEVLRCIRVRLLHEKINLFLLCQNLLGQYIRSHPRHISTKPIEM